MAQNAANDISYYIVIEQVHKSELANIRHWSNLKVAFDGNDIWIKDLDYAQVNSLEVKSIPYKKVYYAQNNKLFLYPGILPDRNIPGVLWTAIERALPVSLPSLNHNYFGISEKIPVNIIPSEMETEAEMMITSIENLEKYLETAPAIRLRKIRWTMINKTRALLIGKPLLPIEGEVFWRQQNFFIPAGYNFDLFVLSSNLNTLLNPENNYWVLWDINATYSLLDKNNLEILSLGSFRTSVLKHSPTAF